MKTSHFTFIALLFILLSGCAEDKEYLYYDIQDVRTMENTVLIATTGQEELEYGSSVAYLSLRGDTIIPFGKYAYFGTDTLRFYAKVLEEKSGRRIGIDRYQNVLFDLVIVDNLPEEYSEGLLRVQRNGKMGFANFFGQLEITCQYDYAKNFENGTAEVTNKAKFSKDGEYTRVESEEWFKIDRFGSKIENKSSFQ